MKIVLGRQSLKYYGRGENEPPTKTERYCKLNKQGSQEKES